MDYSELTREQICIDLNRKFTVLMQGLTLCTTEIVSGNSTGALVTIHKLAEVVKNTSDDIFELYNNILRRTEQAQKRQAEREKTDNS